MTATDMTALERAVIREVSNQLDSEDRAALEAQIQSAVVRSRENTGAGFYIRFDVEHEPQYGVKADTKCCYVGANIRGLDGGLGFILWLEDGYVDYLEGYTEGAGGTGGLDLTDLDFELVTAVGFSD